MIDFERAKIAAEKLRTSDTEERNSALAAMASRLKEYCLEIERANAEDILSAKSNGVSEIMLDRLLFNKARIIGVCDGIERVAELPDPVGEIVERFTTADGLKIKKVRVPFGVIGAIYESRPNVTADIAALCVKTGNACILKGGSDAERTNRAVADVLERALAPYSFSTAVTLVDGGRECVDELITARGKVDLVFPRGGKGLIEHVVRTATVPVIETGAGVCHIYIESSCDRAIAERVLLNAKLSRPSVCNAAETLVIDRALARDFLPFLAKKLVQNGVTLHGDDETARYIPVLPLTERGYAEEYNSLDMSVKIVDDVGGAIAHINEFGTHHSDAIVTADKEKADEFCLRVDSACCYVNASTRFTDGGCFGFGAELGISTQKMHARGPMGLKEMTSYHYVIEGEGQIR